MIRKGRVATRMIHIRLADDVHRRLRIRAAREDTTIQKWVASLIVEKLKTRPRTEGM